MSFAHGGQLKTDTATIHSEPDPAERQLLRKRFELGYGVPRSLEREFLKYHAVINLMNILCNLKTLDGMVSNPFTTDKESMLLYNHLMKNYGNTIPME